MLNIHIKIDDENKKLYLTVQNNNFVFENYENKEQLKQILNRNINHVIDYDVMPIGKEVL